MQTPTSMFPDRHTLTARLTDALNGHSRTPQVVTVLERRPSRLICTFPNEVVRCRWPDGRERRVFIKYESNQQHSAFGHRGNVSYEADVYRNLLHARPDFRPKYLGTSRDADTDQTWLLLEYLDGAMRVCDITLKRKVRQPAAMAEGACWIGQFHTTHEKYAAELRPEFLIRYDAKYYCGWVRRTRKFAAPLLKRFPWLTRLCDDSEKWIGILLAAPPTVIHGEFYTKNLLLCRRQVRVVDWESTAVAAGEIDLAALTEGWPERFGRHCERAYVRARWPAGRPAEFQQRLEAARIYLHFRWLGERADWTVREKGCWRLNELGAAARRLGLI